MLVPAVGGMVLGTWLRKRLPVAVFRRCFLIGLALLGCTWSRAMAWPGI
jgi:uncharacterized membrane protein YfcA